MLVPTPALTKRSVRNYELASTCPLQAVHSLDTQVVEAASILDCLPPLFEALSSRMEYLYCKASVCHGARQTQTLTPVPPTRGQGPISAVNITKSIAE